MLLIDAAERDGGQYDLVVLPVDGGRTPSQLLQTRFSESGARVSPDGRWVAYFSDESGRDEVYVQPFPSLDGKWPISTGGGSQPVWSRRGDELFYRGEGSVMAVRIASEASFSAGPPQKLFDDQFLGGALHIAGYDVSPDGRFLMMKQGATSDQTSAAPQIVVVQNWFEELKRLVPAGR